jgi:hypothetical protein
MVYYFKGKDSSSLMFPIKDENDGALFIFPIDESWFSLNKDGYMYRVSR